MGCYHAADLEGGQNANTENVLSVHTGSGLGRKGIHSLQPVTDDWNNQQPIVNCVNTTGSIKYSIINT